MYLLMALKYVLEIYSVLVKGERVMKKEFKSIFDGITDAEFESMLNESGFSYKKVAPGEGGLKINGKRVESNFFDCENIEMMCMFKNRKNFNNDNNNYANYYYFESKQKSDFNIDKSSNLGKAA